MAIKQCYHVRALNMIFNLLCNLGALVGLGPGVTWQICCVCSDQPCLSSKVLTRNVLSLLFLVADSFHFSPLPPPAVLSSPWLLGWTVLSSQTDRNRVRADLPFLNHTASVGWAQSLTLHCLLLPCCQEKPQTFGVPKNCLSVN